MPLPAMGGSKGGKGKGAGAGKGKGGGGSEGAVLLGPKAPCWECGCGYKYNWASRTRCKECATWAPKKVLTAARQQAKAAAEKAKKKEALHREKEKDHSPRGKGAGRRAEEAPIPEDSSEDESDDDNNGMDVDDDEDATVGDTAERKTLRALLKHTGLVEAIEQKLPGAKTLLMQKAKTPEPETPYKRNLEEACRRRSRIATELARKQKNFEAAQAATKAAQEAEAAAMASLDKENDEKAKVDAEIAALASAEAGLPKPGSPMDFQQAAQSAEKIASFLSDPAERRKAGIPDEAYQQIQAAQVAISERAAKEAEEAKEARQAEADAARAPTSAPGAGSPDPASGRGSISASEGEQAVEEAFSGFDLDGMDQQALEGIKRRMAERLSKSFVKRARVGPARSRSRSAASARP